MRVAILYASKSGASAICARLIGEQLINSQVFNVQEEKPNLEDFDVIILGAGVRDGKIYKPIRDYFKKSHDVLMEKIVGYFICNEKPKMVDEIIADNIPQDLQAGAVAIESFGGYKAKKLPEGDDDRMVGLLLEKVADFAEKIQVK